MCQEAMQTQLLTTRSTALAAWYVSATARISTNHAAWLVYKSRVVARRRVWVEPAPPATTRTQYCTQDHETRSTATSSHAMS